MIECWCIFNLPLSGLDGGASKPFCNDFAPPQKIERQPQQDPSILDGENTPNSDGRVMIFDKTMSLNQTMLFKLCDS